MAIRYDKYNAPYKQSRTTERELFGTRAIDGSAPQSARDQTPSGRLRYLQGATDATPSGRMVERMQAGMTPQEAKQADAEEWRRTFPGGDAPAIGNQRGPLAQVFRAPPNFEGLNQQDIADFKRLSGGGPVMAPPIGKLAAAGPADLGEPDDILKAYAQGAVTGQFKTPYGPVSFDATQPSPLAAPLRAEAPIPASDISAFLPAGTGSATPPPWKAGAKQPYMGSIFGGARRWT